MLTETSSHPAERGPGVWLKARRVRLSLWIAAAEGLIVAVSHDLTKWAVLGLAVVAGVSWAFGRHSKSNGVRQVLWIFAASQLLVLCVPIAFAVVKALAIGLVALLAIAALILLFNRRP